MKLSKVYRYAISLAVCIFLLVVYWYMEEYQNYFQIGNTQLRKVDLNFDKHRNLSASKDEKPIPDRISKSKSTLKPIVNTVTGDKSSITSRSFELINRSKPTIASNLQSIHKLNTTRNVVAQSTKYPVTNHPKLQSKVGSTSVSSTTTYRLSKRKLNPTPVTKITTKSTSNIAKTSRSSIIFKTRAKTTANPTSFLGHSSISLLTFTSQHKSSSKTNNQLNTHSNSLVNRLSTYKIQSSTFKPKPMQKSKRKPITVHNTFHPTLKFQLERISDTSKPIEKLKNNFPQFSKTDANWKIKCLDLSEAVRNRFDYLQYPIDCSTTKKVICDVWGAGMGSTIHHWAYCLNFAYNTNRTMVIDLKKWEYMKGVRSKNGVKRFEDLFQPISKCKLTDHDSKIAVTWPKFKNESTYSHNISVIRLIHNALIKRQKQHIPKICHNTMPSELFYNVIDFKYKPMAWWNGLLSKYVIRPNDKFKQFIDQSRNKLQFQSPIVGLHIRRTDKIQEAKAFSIDKYMIKVEAYYDRLSIQKIHIRKRIFVVTDESQLVDQLIAKYPEYQFIHPPKTQLNFATHNATRYTATGLKYFIRDVFLLAECDYLIATMSSNIGRLAYELHEVIYSRTMSQHFVSLDNEYYIFGQLPSHYGPWIMRAKQNCTATSKNSINLVNGDLLDSCIPSTQSKTMYYGYSKRLQKSGYFPRSCVTYLIDNEIYPDYNQVDKSLHWDEIDRNQTHIMDDNCIKFSITDNIH